MTPTGSDAAAAAKSQVSGRSRARSGVPMFPGSFSDRSRGGGRWMDALHGSGVTRPRMADRISWAGCPRLGETIAVEWDGEDLIECDCVGGYALTDEEPAALRRHGPE